MDKGAPRSQLVCGDSQTTIPAHGHLIGAEEPFFDALFVDGGHFFHQALGDLQHGARIVKPGGHVIVDDCLGDATTARSYVGAAWRQVIGLGLIAPGPRGVCGHLGLCIVHYTG